MKRLLILTAVALTASLAFGSTAYAQEPESENPGSITYNLEIKGIDDSRLSFDFDPGADFTLRDNDSVTRGGLGEDEYTLTLDDDDYRIIDADCAGVAASRVDRNSRSVTIDLDGETVECDIEVEAVKREPTSTPTPVVTPVPATPVPAVVKVPCVLGNQVFFAVDRCPEVPAPTLVPVATSTPAPVFVSQPSPIRPPSTGNGGLLPTNSLMMNGWGDGDSGGAGATYRCVRVPPYYFRICYWY